MNEDKKRLFNLFQSALKKGDYHSVIKLLVGQIGVLLKTDKQGLINIIKKAGGSIDSKISDEELAQKLSYGLLNKNEIFISELVKLIFKGNSYQNDDASKMALGGVTDPVGLLANGISSGIGALGERAAKKKYGKEIIKLKQESESIDKRTQALRIAQKILVERDLVKAGNYVISQEAQLQIEKKKEKEKTNKIIAGSLGLVSIILIFYFISER